MVIGFSVANAVGGFVQVAFFCICLVWVLLKSFRLPIADGALLIVCVVYLSMLKTIKGIDLDVAAIKVIRPFVEGYLIAAFLYGYCRVRDVYVFSAAISGFVIFQLVFAAIMFANPGLRASLLDTIMGNALEDKLISAAMSFRGFGVSAHYLYGLALALGVSAAIMAVCVSSDKKVVRIYYFFTVTFATLLTLINARIGVVTILATYILGVTLFFRKDLFKQLLFIVIGIVPIVVYFGYSYFGDYFEIVVKWLAEGAGQFGNLGSEQALEGNTLGHLSKMLLLPPDVFDVIFGTGGLCVPGEPCYSDIGLVRLVYEGGTVYFGIVTALFYRVHRNIYIFLCQSRISRVRSRLLFAVLVLTFVAALIKGDAYAANDYTRLIIALGYLGYFTTERFSFARVGTQCAYAK